jgi:hypothetical protein
LHFHPDGLKKAIRLVFAAGFIQLAIYQVQVSTSPYYYLLTSTDEFNRKSVGWITIICFFIATMKQPEGFKRTSSVYILRYYFLVAVPLHVLLNSSRSELLVTLLLLTISIGLRFRVFIPLFLIFSALIYSSISFTESSGGGRLGRSIEEVFTTNIESVSDAYTNYRAYENLLIVDKILSRGFAGAAIGCGLGCPAPSYFTLTLNEVEYDEVSIFHNGYLASILHFGLAGVLLVFYLIKTTWQAYRSMAGKSGRAVKICHAMLFAPLFILIMTGFTTGGFMSAFDTLVMLVPISAYAWVVRQPGKRKFRSQAYRIEDDRQRV